MRIWLVDVDGHNYPNLALMRISAYHKELGDDVEWWKGDLFYYDIVYKSKIFSDVYSEDVSVWNAGEVREGGSGYCITLKDGKEIFNQELNHTLPDEIERMFPDYSIYPEFDYAVAMTSRGCPRGCPFCHVAAKEGRRSYKVADVKDFWNGQKLIEVLDPNITACPDKHNLFEQYVETGAWVSFNQGLDARMLTATDIEIINRMKINRVHFAWDNPNEDLTENFKMINELFRIKNHRQKVVYILTNFNSTMEQNLYRIYTLRDLGYHPYVMVYDKPNAPTEIKRLQRWVNNRFIFTSCKNFYDYNG